MNLEKLGTFIHKKREEVGLPLAKAAQKAGIGRSTLWILETGKNPKTGKPSRPSKDILERLAQVLHMSQVELEEALTLADYTVTRQSSQALNQISAATKTESTQQITLSPPATITEINGTVYYAYDGYLQAFNAKTGDRLWSSSTVVSPPEPADVEYSELQADFPRRRSSASANPTATALNDKTPDPLPQQNQSHQPSKEKQGLLFVLSGIAGSENDDIITGLKETGIDIFVAPIYTTRPRWEGERRGNLHMFINEKDFIDYIAKGMLLTHLYNDMRMNKPPAWYGHLRAPIIESLRIGQDVIMDAGPEEAAMLHSERPDAILILLRLPPHDVRTEEEEKKWAKRHQQIEYNYTIDYERGRLQETVGKLKDILLLEHEKVQEERTASEPSESQTSNERVFI